MQVTTLDYKLAMATATFAAAVSASGLASAQTATADQIVTTMRTLAGGQKARPSGAKGQCFIGTFTPTTEAKGLSASLAFEKPSRVVARFSVGSGKRQTARVIDLRFCSETSEKAHGLEGQQAAEGPRAH